MYKPHVYAITTKQHGQGFSDNHIALFYMVISNVPIRLRGFHSDLLVLLFSQEDVVVAKIQYTYKTILARF